MQRGMNILIVDDEEDIRSVIHERFEERNDAPMVAGNATEALALARERYFDIAILDVRLPGISGLELWKQLKELQPGLEVLFITGHGSIDTALEAMKLGAYDYLTKPLELAELELLVRKAFEKRSLQKQTILLREELARRGVRANLVGTSRCLEQVLQSVHRVARTESPVLIQGETGTGKELVAQEVHAASNRSDNQLIAVNCGALQETLVENELFGHEKGAFTGAVAFKRGLFEAADEGTLFIDEIGELTTGAQVKLLRVLEDGSFRRLGDSRETNVDVRIVCATNKDLETLVAEGKFREDLFYRLNVFRIDVPPLRARKEDIPLLAYHFLKTGRVSRAGGPTEISPDGMKFLLAHNWPGNIRELSNAVEYATIQAMDRTVIEATDFPPTIRRAVAGKPAVPVPLPESVLRPIHAELAPPLSRLEESGRPTQATDPSPCGPGSPPSPLETPGTDPVIGRLGLSLADLEREHILESLKKTCGNRTRAAKSLGISVRHLRRKLHAYDYQDPKKEESS